MAARREKKHKDLPIELHAEEKTEDKFICHHSPLPCPSKLRPHEPVPPTQPVSFWPSQVHPSVQTARVKLGGGRFLEDSSPWPRGGFFPFLIPYDLARFLELFLLFVTFSLEVKELVLVADVDLDAFTRFEHLCNLL